MNHKKIKFVLIGILNTLVGYILFSIFFYIIDNYFIALFIAYILGVLFNFKTYSKYVFTNSDKQIFINFILIYMGIFLFNNFILYIVNELFNINYYISQFVAIIIVTPILYILNVRYVFIDNKDCIQ